MHGQRVLEHGTQGVQVDPVSEASTHRSNGGDLCEPRERDHLHGHGTYLRFDPPQARKKVSEALGRKEQRHSRVKGLRLLQ